MTFQFPNLATSSYQSFVEENRASSAASYGLVTVLFEELGETLGLIIESVRRGEDTLLFQCWANARATLSGLDKELNFEVAGDLAQTLRIIYTEAAKRIQLEGRDSCVERIESAREMIQEIEKAWTEIVTLN